MNIHQIIFRPMEPNEQSLVHSLEKKVFSFVEGLFVGKPRNAIVAEYCGKIIGAIVYSPVGKSSIKTAYIDAFFVSSEYQGKGIGKYLLAQAISYLSTQGYQCYTALIKDDNVASWKNFMGVNFRRCSLLEMVKHLGLLTALRQYFCTPMLISAGMDLYLLHEGSEAKAKEETPIQWLYFLLGNLILAFPLWIINAHSWLTVLGAYSVILAVFLLTRWVGALFSGLQYRFRLNNCGGFLCVLLGCFGNLFPLNANWYPLTYENTEAFRKKLALPELLKWAVLSTLPLLRLIPNAFCNALASIGCVFLVFSVLPFYPFEALGAGRIFRYNKFLWGLTVALSGAIILISNIV